MSFKVGLDDGHGMSTPGKRTVALKEDLMFNGKLRKKGTIIHENEFNEVIMHKVEPHLKRCGISYIETAPTDSDTALSTRANRANEAGCDVLVSIHANALVGDKWQTGAYGLVVIKTKNCQSKTDRLADIMYKHLKTVDFPSNGETKYGVRVDVDISGFTLAILRQTNMPAVLVELGFMDNWTDVKRMCTAKFQNECAEQIARAICEYAGIKFVPATGGDGSIISTDHFQVKIVCEKALNVRSKPDWNAEVVTTVPNGQHLDVVATVNAYNGDTHMYKLESGLYITASPKYSVIVG